MEPLRPDGTLDRSQDFTASGYRELLRGFLDMGYAVSDFETVQRDRRQLVLRHDIDMSVQAALAMSEIENDLGVTASYFVLLRSELYNPFSLQNARAIQQIAASGHEIGLHFDASLYSPSRVSLEREAAGECEILENLLGQPVWTISFHRPADALLGLHGRIAGRRHTYEPYFFDELGYCSDSRGEWKHGHPLDHAATKAGKALQLLTHPIWWSEPAPVQPVSRLHRLRTERDAVYGATLAANCEPYRSAIEC